MDTKEKVNDIADKNFDKFKYVEQIQSDEELRDLIIDQMISNKNIMVYYHCYEIYIPFLLHERHIAVTISEVVNISKLITKLIYLS